MRRSAQTDSEAQQVAAQRLGAWGPVFVLLETDVVAQQQGFFECSPALAVRVTGQFHLRASPLSGLPPLKCHSRQRDFVCPLSHASLPSRPPH